MLGKDNDLQVLTGRLLAILVVRKVIIVLTARIGVALQEDDKIRHHHHRVVLDMMIKK